jgi:uroporphyrinogen-III synthase
MKRVLYLGLDPTHYKTDGYLIHCPVISIQARSHQEPDIQEALKQLEDYTHLLITSKSALKILLDMLNHFNLTAASLQNKRFIAVGAATAKRIQEQGFMVESVAKEESSEGLIKEVLGHLPATCYVLWPHSAQSRTIIIEHLDRQPYRYKECIL